MTDNDNTVFGTAQEQTKNESKKLTNNGWQQVTIGGVMGVMLGAAGTIAANSFANKLSVTGEDAAEAETAGSQTAANGLPVVEVDQSLPFGEAFAAARSEVGPDGVFHWHGGIYSTHTAEEWYSMSDAERAQFSQQALGVVQSSEHSTLNTHHPTHDTHHSTHPDDKPETPEQPKHEAEEPEVHFLGVEQVQTNDGQNMNVGHMVIGEQEVALVDIDDNMVFDVAISDRNQNGQLDENEVVDISEQELSVTDFALISAQEDIANQAAQPEMANNESQQDYLADDMPDYMNDADIQAI